MKRSFMLKTSGLFLCIFLHFVNHAVAQEDRKKNEAEMRKGGSQIQNRVALADSSNWNRGGMVALNFGQSTLKNWAAGGQSSLALFGIINWYSNYTGKVWAWDNKLDINYGMVKSGHIPFLKNDDRFEFLSKAGRVFSGDWYYAGVANIRTQLTPTFKDGKFTSSFLSPAYFIAAAGMDYKPNEKFSLFISPATGKFTYVHSTKLADSGAFGVIPGQHLRKELGAYLITRYTGKLMENIGLQAEIDLFNNYTDPNKPNRKNIDVTGEAMLTFKINKFFLASINTALIYDNDIPVGVDDDGDGVFDRTAPRTQFKEILGIGVTYKWQ